METLREALVGAKEKNYCVTWGCTTCSAQEFINSIEVAIGNQKIKTRVGSPKLATQIKNLVDIPHLDGLVFLLRVCANQVEQEELCRLLGGTPAGLLYDQMLEEKRKRDLARPDHEMRNDPNIIEENRATKRKQKAQAHEERLKQKAIRDIKWREKTAFK